MKFCTIFLLFLVASALAGGPCSKPCPDIYAPLCIDYGGNQKTVKNFCELDRFNCMTGECKLIILVDGATVEFKHLKSHFIHSKHTTFHWAMRGH